MAEARAGDRPGTPAGSLRKALVGAVASDKMNKTVVVVVETFKQHRLYHKTLRRTKRYKAHDERNECRVGDRVRIVEMRPLSKEKRWRVVEILSRGNVPEVRPTTIGAEILEPGSVPPAEEGEEAPEVEE
jgi:small subunit ribosomal protein S17